ncbi:MAG: hypothetical protein ABJR05_14615 [Balneola sp.]
MRNSKNLERYCNRRKEGEILNKSYDFPIVALSLDVSYGVASKEYKNFLYGKNDIGFFNQFTDIRKGALKRAFKFFKENPDAPINKSLKEKIRSISRDEYWKVKDFLSSKLKSPQVFGDNEELKNYVLGDRKGLEVNHLIPLKDIQEVGLSLENAYSAIDPKNQVAMTKIGHFSGKNYGHAGNYNNSPNISDPYDVPSSITNDYKQALSEKREELINIDLFQVGFSVGIVSLLIAQYLQNSKHIYHFQRYNLSTQDVLEKSSLLFFTMGTREVIRESLQNSEHVHEFLFDIRDSLIKRNIKNGTDSPLADYIGDIDALSDALSIMGGGTFYKGIKHIKMYKNRGYINKSDIFGDTLEIGIIGGGKYALGAYMDPTGASFVVVSIYFGGKSIYKIHVRRSKIQTNEEIQIWRKNHIKNKLNEFLVE